MFFSKSVVGERDYVYRQVELLSFILNSNTSFQQGSVIDTEDTKRNGIWLCFQGAPSLIVNERICRIKSQTKVGQQYVFSALWALFSVTTLFLLQHKRSTDSTYIYGCVPIKHLFTEKGCWPDLACILLIPDLDSLRQIRT